MTHHLSIDYDEGVLDSYRAVVLKGPKREEIRFETGNPELDWVACIEYAKLNELLLVQSSSTTHFVFDNVEWRFALGDDGIDYLVLEDRPEVLEEIELVKKQRPAMSSISVAEALEAIRDQPDGCGIDIGDLAIEMGFVDGLDIEYAARTSDLSSRFTTRWISKWICTDTSVGSHVVYFDEEPLAVAHKEYRKGESEFVFICDVHTYEKVFNQIAKALMPPMDFENVAKLEADSPMPHRNVDVETLADPIKKLVEDRIAEQGRVPTGP